MPQKKYLCYVVDSDGHTSNLLFIDIAKAGDVFIKQNEQNPSNELHISIHPPDEKYPSWEKHIRIGREYYDTWNKSCGGETTIDHNHVMYKDHFHNAEPIVVPQNTTCKRIAMPDDMNAVQIILMRLPKNEAISADGCVLEKYKILVVESYPQNWNWILAYRFYQTTAEEIRWILKDKCNFIMKFDNKEDLIGQDVTRIKKMDGDIANPAFIDYYFTKQDIEEFNKLSDMVGATT